MSEKKLQSGGGMDAYVAAVAVAQPDRQLDQGEALAIMQSRYDAELSDRSRAMMRKVFRHPSVQRRRIALELTESPGILCDESPDDKIKRFTRWAVELSCRAARQALLNGGVEPGEITVLVINTCTGYICPGITSYVIENLGLRAEIRAHDLVGSGCGGAIPNLQVAGALLQHEDDMALCISVEIATATFQMEDDPSLIVSNAIFADGAGAALISRRAGGLRIVDTRSLHVPLHREAIRYVHRHGGQLHNQLSARLPELVAPVVGTLVRDVLDRHGLTVSDVRHWAVHSGGEKVIDAVEEELVLGAGQLDITRRILESHGNMSSATVWFGLDRLMSNGRQPGDWWLMIGFGAGMSVHACLLRSV
ncbi:MAG: type III polyketide synthase [Verrucomicrobia bacterium]|nr:type III polyketide synthase [Verrucomicrobiota bacterium]